MYVFVPTIRHLLGSVTWHVSLHRRKNITKWTLGWWEEEEEKEDKLSLA